MGKTTLLAMFYRQASSGRIPGLRMAAADAAYRRVSGGKDRPDRVGPAHGGLARRDRAEAPALSRARAIRPDRQGLPGRTRHARIRASRSSSSSPTATPCLLCLDPEGSTDLAERRRRQQEVENLLERYIDRSEDLSMGRPVALLLTKFDRVLAGTAATESSRGSGAEPPAELVERLVDERYGMTRHALAEHAPEGAIFAVSSFGPGAVGNRPPAELRPLGLEGPLGWVAEQLEARDRADMEQLWELAPARPAPPRALCRGLRAPLPAIKPVVRVPRAAQKAAAEAAMALARLAGQPP